MSLLLAALAEGPAHIIYLSASLSFPSCSLDEKIKKLDAQLAEHKKVISKTRGAAQMAAKRRAMNVRE